MRALAVVLAVAVAGCNDPNSVTADTGVKACATVVSCRIAVGSGGISACSAAVSGLNNPDFARAARISAPEVNCLAAAGKDCDAARRCLNGGQTPQTCTGSSESCSGTSLSSCSDLTGVNGAKGTSLFPCADVGEMCVAAGNRVGCGLGTCSGASTCAGDLLNQCDNGILHTLDCAAYNATCAVTLGVAHCRGKGPACQGSLNPFAPVRCDGNALVLCFDGQEARLDCAAQQTGCFANVKGQAWGCALGNECDPSTYTNTCVGTTLGFCNNGKKAAVDCAHLGFTSCQAANGGSCS